MRKFLVIGLCLLVLSGCDKKPDVLKPYVDPLVEFMPVADISGYKNMPNTSNLVKKGSLEIINQLYKEKRDFVFYIGHDYCAWCMDLFPVLMDVINEYDLTVIYVNDAEEFDKGIFESNIFSSFIDNFYDYLEYDENYEKELYVPFVVFVREGKVIFSNIGTVDNHDAYEQPLSKAQTKKLTNRLSNACIKFLENRE